MSTLFVLVGVPASGKSTWVSDQQWAKDCAYLSTDQYVEKFARRTGKTYSEVFDRVMPLAIKLMTKAAYRARMRQQNVIWDQTSTTVNSRARKLRMFSRYYKVAVVFLTPDLAELTRRLKSRPGKRIPDHIITNMIRNLSIPTIEEGFDEILMNEVC